MIRRVAVSRLELEMLIEASTDDRFVDIAIGPDSTKVLVTPDNAWAIDLLLICRSQLGEQEAAGDVLRAIEETEASGVLLGCLEWSLKEAQRCE